MIEKLDELARTHRDLQHKLADPATLGDPGAYRDTTKALAKLSPVVELYQRYRKALHDREERAHQIELRECGDEDRRIDDGNRRGPQREHHRDLARQPTHAAYAPREPVPVTSAGRAAEAGELG